MNPQYILYIITLSWLCACSASTHNSEANSLKTQFDVSQQAAKLTPEENRIVLKELGKNFLYGEGVGSTILNLGTTVIFPPYGLFLIGNLALSASGHEPLGVGSLLAGEQKDAWNRTYSNLISNPGKLAAALAGEEYRNNELAQRKIEKYISLSRIDPVNDDY